MKIELFDNCYTNLLYVISEIMDNDNNNDNDNDNDDDGINYLISFAKKWVNYGRKEVNKLDIETKIDRFVTLCQVATTKEEFFELVNIYDQLFKLYIMSIKQIYNQLIGWALPSEQVLTVVFAAYKNHIKRYPGARIIDLGAGSGIFSYLFNQMGIPADKIIALDLKEPTHSDKGQRKFWPITVNDQFQFKPDDILFVAWGSGTSKEVDRYCENRGTCVILLGETDCGCTFPSDYFEKHNGAGEEDNEWQIESYHVSGPASAYSEYLTVNIRK